MDITNSQREEPESSRMLSYALLTIGAAFVVCTVISVGSLLGCAAVSANKDAQQSAAAAPAVSAPASQSATAGGDVRQDVRSKQTTSVKQDNSVNQGADSWVVFCGYAMQFLTNVLLIAVLFIQRRHGACIKELASEP